MKMSEEYGYDEEFVDPPPEYLKCIICRFVLKNPVQIMRCGHRYCDLCFERIEGYSKHLNSPFCCPIDREEIEITQVFKDTGMTRIIADLQVKCRNNTRGCLWSGELRNIEAHKKQCNHVVKEANTNPTASLGKEDKLLINDMCKRLDKCEEALREKEKDLAHIKFNLQETKENVNKRDKEIDVLKLKNTEIAREISLLKETNKTLQENVDKVLLKCENNYLSSKNEMDQLKMEKMVQKETEHLNNEEIRNLKADIEEVNRKLTERKMKEDQLRKTETRMKTMENGLKGAQDQLQRLNCDIKTKQNHVDKSLNDVKALMKGLQRKTDKSLNNSKAHLEDLSKSEKSVSNKFNQVFQEHDELRAHINHADGLLPYEKNVSLKNTSFVWRVNNFKEIFDAKGYIESAKFYCCPYGHLCQLFGVFLPGSENMTIRFRLCKGKNSGDVANFKMNILFELLYNDNTKWLFTITSEDVDAYREERFTFHGSNDETVGLGVTNFCKKDDFDKYVNENICTIICTLTPPN